MKKKKINRARKKIYGISCWHIVSFYTDCFRWSANLFSIK